MYLQSYEPSEKKKKEKKVSDDLLKGLIEIASGIP